MYRFAGRLLPGREHPGIFGDEVKVGNVEVCPVLFLRIVAPGYVDGVGVDVFFDDEPGASAQVEPLPLPDGVEPETSVASEDFSGFEFYDVAGPFAEVAADEVVVVYLAEEADALAVFAPGIEEVFFFGNAAHFVLHQVADGEEEFADLAVVDLAEEVGLVFYGVGGGGEPGLSADLVGGGVVSGGDAVEVVPHGPLESAEFDELVAHDVGVGRKAAPDFVDGVGHDVVPIFPVEVYDVERAAVLACHGRGHLDVFLRRAVERRVVVLADFDVEAVRSEAFFLQQMHDYRAVYSAGKQSCYGHFGEKWRIFWRKPLLLLGVWCRGFRLVFY